MAAAADASSTVVFKAVGTRSDAQASVADQPARAGETTIIGSIASKARKLAGYALSTIRVIRACTIDGACLCDWVVVVEAA